MIPLDLGDFTDHQQMLKGVHIHNAFPGNQCDSYLLGALHTFLLPISTRLLVLTSCQATSRRGCMLAAKCRRCSQTVIVTKFPLRALFPLPRVLPKVKAVAVEAHLSEPQASKLILNLMAGGSRSTRVQVCF